MIIFCGKRADPSDYLAMILSNLLANTATLMTSVISTKVPTGKGGYS